jgi:hypothetical protein
VNLAVLERMVAEGDLSRDAFAYLLNCRAECEWLDYKEQLPLDSDQALCNFGKDVLAFKNVGGGYILVGVRDKTWEQLGLRETFTLDSKGLRDQIQRCTGVTLEVDVVCHELQYDGLAKQFALLLIRSSRKRSKRRSPTLVGKDFCAAKPFGLRRGEIFVRRGDSTIKVTAQAELQDLLDNLESQADADAVRSDTSPSPFAIELGTFRLLDRGFEHFVGRQDLREKLLTAIRGDPRIWIVNVHGPGGVGKSALVNWAVYELYGSREFEAILQLTAKETILTDTGIRRFSRSLYSLENLLDHVLLLFEESPDRDLQSKKALARDLLSAWKTLLVLDNMETVSDGRILSFIQELPVDSKARIVLTSRQKTGGWELPLPVTEMTLPETTEFIRIKAVELGIPFPTDASTAARVAEVSGGLPLATQWIIGRFRTTRQLQLILESVKGKDSPVLEFTFRNIWNTLSSEAKTVLAVMSIFDGPTTIQEIVVSTEMQPDRAEKALAELVEVTLVTRSTQQSDGRTLFTALPITLSFARNELGTMGELEVHCRQSLQRFNEQMELQSSEVARFRGEFERFGLESPNEKRASILCRRAESEMFAGNADSAELLFKQARELAPQSAYVHARSASYELARNRVGTALERVTEACARATKKTGALCYTVKARVLDVQHDKGGRVEALEKALQYDPADAVLRHQYGVALSRAGLEQAAVDQFSRIIGDELKRVPPRDTLIMALTTRIINLRRLDRNEDAAADLAQAKALLVQHPHLAHAAGKLTELE